MALTGGGRLPPGELAEQGDPGIGQVSGCLTSTKTIGNMGTMSMFEKAGFTATGRDEIRTSDPYHPGDYVVMRMRV